MPFLYPGVRQDSLVPPIDINNFSFNLGLPSQHKYSQSAIKFHGSVDPDVMSSYKPRLQILSHIILPVYKESSSRIDEIILPKGKNYINAYIEYEVVPTEKAPSLGILEMNGRRDLYSRSVKDDLLRNEPIQYRIDSFLQLIEKH